MDRITIVKYIDDKYDYYRLKTADEEFLLSGTGLGVERSDIILADIDDKDVLFHRYDMPMQAQLISVSNIEVKKLMQINGDVKETALYIHASQLLSMLEIADLRENLCELADKEKAENIIGYIMGKKLEIKTPVTLENVLKSIMNSLGVPFGENVLKSAAERGVLQTVKRRAKYFKEETACLQAIGLYEELISGDSLLYNDELCALCYNLLLLENDGIINLVRLAKENEAFAEKITSTYERSLVYTYYEHTEIKVKKKTFYDLDSKPMTGYYIPGGILNHTYINEYTTIDNEWHVFCVLLDRHIRKWGRAIPVLYNDKTGETIQLHDRMNVRIFAMLMTKQKMVYFIADESIYCYNIATREKKVVFTEPDGCWLQEVPTITDDGRYLLFFYGTQVQHLPNKGCVLDTQTGECKTVLSPQWVQEHFGHQKNPFAGHFIINPTDHTTIHFLHGGGSAVDDRMWIVDTKTGRKWEPYKAKYLPDGSFGEGLTHWFWMPGSRNLGFVRIRRDTDLSIGKGGICYVDIDNPQNPPVEMVTEREAIHSTPDYLGKLFVYDTYNDEPEKYKYTSDISLYDSESKTEKLLHRINIIKSHPGHPHPIFSADGTHILFAFSPEGNGVVCVCSEKVR